MEKDGYHGGGDGEGGGGADGGGGSGFMAGGSAPIPARPQWRDLWCSTPVHDEFLKELCYNYADPTIAVYWLKPGDDIGGHLLEVCFERHAIAMAAASLEHNPIVLYVDHVGLIATKNVKDDVSSSGHIMPKVFSPKKGGYGKNEEESVVCGFGSDEGAARCEYSDCESIDDPDFNDSDYDFDDDDCLFDENVDVAVTDYLVGKKPIQYFPKGEDDVPDEDELQIFDEPKYNCKYYNPVTDKDNPVFKLGMVFPSANDFRQALAMYAVNERHQVKKTRNNSTRIEAQCCEGCPWKIIATKDSRYNASFSVKTFNDVHDCERVWDFPRCDILLNNSCEVFNRWIFEARELPVLSMLERIICQIMTRNYEKEKEGRETWTRLTCPKIKKKLDKNTELAALYTPKPAGARVLKVGSSPKTIYIVELNLRSCTCRRWQLTGIPCAHAIACLRHEKIKPEKLVADCYSIQTFMKAYGTHVRPVRDRKEWKKLNGPEVKPPYYEKVVGKPRKSRRKAPEEKQNGTKLSKAGVQMHCSYCGG
ncbi:hypothetical protein ACQ4PT_053092 [Festuca glaucescens]